MTSKRSVDSDLAASISSRICHDLVSPVGAIVNGVDLIREIGVPGLGDEFGLISQSAERASGVLQFFRLAFGAVEAEAAQVTRSSVIERARGMIETPRISFRWTGEAGPPLDRSDARIVCLMLLVARSLTGRDGTVSIGFDAFASTPTTVVTEGSRAADFGTLLGILNGTVDSVTPRSVEFVMLAKTARSNGTRLLIEDLDTRLVIRAETP